MTKHLVRNIIMFVIFLLLAVGGFFAWQALTHRSPAADSTNQSGDSGSQDAADQVMAEEPSSLSVDGARSAISSYYLMLSRLDHAGLRAAGFDETAGAVENGWVVQMAMQVYPEFITPDVTAMPQPVGVYAGNDLYDVRSFFTSPPPIQCVTSVVTGETGPVGWIYHDALENRWHFVDPLIPTYTQAPQVSNQSRVSEDGLVSVKMSCPGIFCNSWWAMGMFAFDVTSAAKSYNIDVVTNKFDEGVTVTVTDGLSKGIKASEIPVVPTLNPDGSQQPMVAKASGVAVLERGGRDMTKASPERIGQPALRLDGHDLCPVSIILRTGNQTEENVAPLFPVNNEPISESSSLLNTQQLEQYDVTDKLADPAYVQQLQADVEQQRQQQQQQGAGTTETTNPAANATGATVTGTTTETPVSQDAATAASNQPTAATPSASSATTTATTVNSATPPRTRR